MATIAQEINNRLDSLCNMMHLLRTNANLDEPAKEPVEQAEEEIARLSKLTKQRLAPHRETDLPAAMKMTTVLDDVCSLLQGKLQVAKIEVRRKYQSEGEVTIHASDLRQVFNNLISNAIDAMDKGGILELSVEDHTHDEGRVMVCDSGCGIPDAQIGHIFEPFFSTQGEKGTGIGLWVVKSIIGTDWRQHFSGEFRCGPYGDVFHPLDSFRKNVSGPEARVSTDLGVMRSYESSGQDLLVRGRHQKEDATGFGIAHIMHRVEVSARQ